MQKIELLANWTYRLLVLLVVGIVAFSGELLITRANGGGPSVPTSCTLLSPKDSQSSNPTSILFGPKVGNTMINKLNGFTLDCGKNQHSNPSSKPGPNTSSSIRKGFKQLGANAVLVNPSISGNDCINKKTVSIQTQDPSRTLQYTSFTLPAQGPANCNVTWDFGKFSTQSCYYNYFATNRSPLWELVIVHNDGTAGVQTGETNSPGSVNTWWNFTLNGVALGRFNVSTALLGATYIVGPYIVTDCAPVLA